MTARRTPPARCLLELVTSTFLVISCVLSWYAFVEVGGRAREARVALFPFISFGDLHADWALRVDPLTAVMLVVVTTVSALVHTLFDRLHGGRSV